MAAKNDFKEAKSRIKELKHRLSLYNPVTPEEYREKIEFNSGELTKNTEKP